MLVFCILVLHGIQSIQKHLCQKVCTAAHEQSQEKVLCGKSHFSSNSLRFVLLKRKRSIMEKSKIIESPEIFLNKSNVMFQVSSTVVLHLSGAIALEN